MESLKLKLHGENYFSSESQALRKKINYGKIMHEVFEGINTPGDISPAVRKLVLEGKFSGREILLHVCLEPPEDVEATEFIDLTTPGGASLSCALP